MSIPFTQYVRPDGARRAEKIDRPANVEAMAQKFIDTGGRFECEVLRDGAVALSAVFEVDSEDQDIAIEVSENGPDVPDAVDRLVLSAYKFLDERPAP